MQDLVHQQIWQIRDWQRPGPSSKLVDEVGGQESSRQKGKDVGQAGEGGGDEDDEEGSWQQEKEGRVPTVSEEPGHETGFCRECRLRARWLSKLVCCWREEKVGDTMLAPHPMHQVGELGGAGN